MECKSVSISSLAVFEMTAVNDLSQRHSPGMNSTMYLTAD